jgi:hypothetical protein
MSTSNQKLAASNFSNRYRSHPQGRSTNPQSKSEIRN